MDKNAWLLVYDLCYEPWDFMICLDETDALETYMSLVEEELYEEFYNICQDDLEDIETLPLVAQRMKLYDTMWDVMEVPIIYGDTCCEELPKPARG